MFLFLSFWNFQIGLKQGLEMLKIFKSYSAKTSLLDDFDFYENREMLLKANRSSKQDSNSDVYEQGKVVAVSLWLYISV